MKYVLYYKGEKIKESTNKEYLIAELYSLGKVYTAKGKIWIDPDYEIKAEDWEVVEDDNK